MFNDLKPNEVMQVRWLHEIQAAVPAIDFDDLNITDDFAKARQFAPEFSQKAYMSMLKKDIVIGNYTSKKGQFEINASQREQMIILIQNLHKAKEYKEETLHLATSVADRYLASLAKAGKETPNLIHLATISVLLGAKLEQPMSPSFLRMINLLPKEQRETTTKNILTRLEEKIIKELKFEMHYAGPIPFVQRFQRYFNID